MKDSKLETTQRALVEYRSTRKNGKVPIPNHLKDKILSLLGQYSVPDLADRLGLADCLIYKWKKAKIQGSLQEKFSQTCSFVELAFDQTSLNDFESVQTLSVVEFARPDGGIMRIPINLKPESFNILMANFFGGLPHA